MSLKAQLHRLKSKLYQDRKCALELSKENPFGRARVQIRTILAVRLEERINLVKKIPIFTGLTAEGFSLIAHELEDIEYNCGDKIIVQGEKGDAFFIVEEGLVSVQRCKSATEVDVDPGNDCQIGAAKIGQEISVDILNAENVSDINGGTGESTHELTRLGPGNFFGEIALQTDEARLASVVVLSPTAKCLKLTKAAFDHIHSVLKALNAVKNEAIASRVLENMEIFKTLSSETRKILVNTMNLIKFPETTFICRQGTVGNTFYVLVEGECEVTQTTADSKTKTIGKIFPGDYFGTIVRVAPLSLS